MSMERPTCRTCAYFRLYKNGDDDLGECHRFPPTIAAMQEQVYDNVYFGLFCEVSPDNWCGEHHLFPAYLASLKPLLTPPNAG